jgi:hypothetical protein
MRWGVRPGPDAPPRYLGMTNPKDPGSPLTVGRAGSGLAVSDLPTA